MPRSKFAKYSCDICQKILRRKQTFEDHMKTHLPPEEKPFKCEICDKSFGSQAWLTRHRKIHSAEGSRKLEQIVNEQEAEHFSGACQSQKQSEVSGYEAGVADPFNIFPREIWCMILQNVDYFTDLQTLFVVHPGLEGLHRRKRQLYLFDQVIPHIAEWMGERDLLSCRLVSRQWSIGVDNFLENHPSRRAYTPDVGQHVTGQMWDPSTYSKCYHGQRFQSSYVSVLYRNVFERRYSIKQGNLNSHLLKMEGHPAEINPFVGRSIKLNLDLFGVKEKSTREDFLKNMLIFLSKWGKHIWFLELRSGWNQSDAQFVNFILKTLELLPNLKSLHFDVTWEVLKIKHVRETVAELQHLEALKISGHWLSLAEFVTPPAIIPDYARHIRRLHLLLDDSNMDSYAARRRFPTLVPNLTELFITRTDLLIEIGNLKCFFDSILHSIQAPQLYSLCMESSSPRIRTHFPVYLEYSKMCEWLQRFPNLKHFNHQHYGFNSVIVSDRYSEQLRGTESCILPSIESISFHIDTLKCSPRILSCFPSLRCLQIYAKIPGSNSPSVNEEGNFRTCNRTVGLEHFWEVLENLNKLTVIIIIGCYSHNRARYRFTKSAVETYLHRMDLIE